MLRVNTRARTLWYRDTPYAIRDPAAERSALLPSGLREDAYDITAALATKIRAIEAYRTQLGFQFGGEHRMREAMAGFHRAEAERAGMDGWVECFLVSSVD